MKRLEWTKPYCGVSHLETDKFLCTVEDWEKFTDISIYRKPARISEVHSYTCYGSDHLKDAKNYCKNYIS